jgi:hypothetical protein
MPAHIVNDMPGVLCAMCDTALASVKGLHVVCILKADKKLELLHTFLIPPLMKAAELDGATRGVFLKGCTVSSVAW